jgi:Flp pilus assembly protein TadD
VAVEQALRTTVELDPANAEATVELARISEALAAAQEAASTEKARVAMMDAIYRDEQGDMAGAIASFRKATEYTPNNAKVRQAAE